MSNADVIKTTNHLAKVVDPTRKRGRSRRTWNVEDGEAAINVTNKTTDAGKSGDLARIVDSESACVYCARNIENRKTAIHMTNETTETCSCRFAMSYDHASIVDPINVELPKQSRNGIDDCECLVANGVPTS